MTHFGFPTGAHDESTPMNLSRPLTSLLLAVGILAVSACAAPQTGTPLRAAGAVPVSSSTDTTTGSGATDAVTHQWILGMCTDLHAVLVAVHDVPSADDSSPVKQYRRAYVRYYLHLSAAARHALDSARSGMPPNVVDGPAIHQKFIAYLTGMTEVASSGGALVQQESSAAHISADVTQLRARVQNLRIRTGPGGLSSPQLAAAVAATPECKDLSSS